MLDTSYQAIEDIGCVQVKVQVFGYCLVNKDQEIIDVFVVLREMYCIVNKICKGIEGGELYILPGVN